MYLKRGLKRQSCDFCFRRKVRCDRPSRISEGHSTCTHCELRELPCITESGEILNHNKRSIGPVAGSISTPIPSDPGSEPTANGGGRAQASPTQAIVVENNIVSPPLSTPAHYPTSNVILSPSANIQDVAAGFEWQEIDWDLGTGSISFLDSIFPQTYNFETMSNIPSFDASGQSGLWSSSQSPYDISGLDARTLDEAIEAYFDLVSLALPILSRDAFMTDYKSRRASPALVYAVACRGCPFICTTDKWTVQQKLAGHFRQKFLEARLAAESEHSIRLDDLEALALMINFPYGPSEDATTSLNSQLGNLFLTHDSLVLMTLQYQILCHTVLSGCSSEPLCGAEDRKRLLLWHVYGTDAFRTLEHKVPSRVRDTHMETPDLPAHEERTYLDSILALAIIAKKIHQIFSGFTPEQVVTNHDEITKLYDQLAEWRSTLAPHLQSSSREGTSSSAQDDLRGSSRAHSLQRAVLMFLENNCYMQIQACASRSGIDKDQSLEAIMLNYLIEYKTLKTAHSIIGALPGLQLKVYHSTPGGIIGYPLIDLVPGILRDICAGTCRWMTDYAKKLLSCDRRTGAESFVVGAMALRDAVATAGSYMDTQAMVGLLDEELNPLKQMIKDADEC